MFKVAVIEDDIPTSQQLTAWIQAARPGIQVDNWFTRDDAEAAIARESYDVVVLDIELGRERNAGIAIINAINKSRQGTPVLVVSAMPAAIYRSIMKALDAWDYLQKKGPSSFRVELDTGLRAWSMFAVLPCGRVKAGRSPPEGLGLDAVARP